MQRLFLSIATVQLLAVAANAQAQCFEQNFGVLAPLTGGSAGYGDDVTFDLVPMNITFPMGGLAATYTHASISDNGIMYLTNGQASTGATGAGNGYQSTAYFVGDVGSDPRIAPFFADLWSDPINGGGVWINNTIPGKFVVTWESMVEWWATTQPGNPAVFTFQAQLFDTGEVLFYYGPNITGATYTAQIVTRCGVSEGNGVVDPGSMDLSVTNTQLSSFCLYEEFPVPTCDLANSSVQFIYGGTGYINVTSACTPAYNVNYGQGCYDISDSFYQLLPDASTAPAILDGNSMVMTPAGVGEYLVQWGGATYVTPTGQVPLVLTDDGEVAQAISTPFLVDGGLVSTLYVGANAVISVAPNTVATGYTPNANDMLNATVTAWYSHHDYNVQEAGSGPITFFEAGGIAYFTWEGVESYSTPLATNQSTLQFQFDSNTGTVSIVWQQIDGDPTSAFGSAHLIGWSSGGASINDGGINIAATAPFVTIANNIDSLSLSAAGAPISTGTTGSLITYTTDNMIEFGGGFYLGINIISANQVPAGLPLAIIGASGCTAYVGTLDYTQTMFAPSSTQSVTFPLPAGVPSGFQFFSQSVNLIQPNSLPNGQNAFGITTSNGVLSSVSSF
jgi:FlaG/FlaF family flagellin (archaellin)